MNKSTVITAVCILVLAAIGLEGQQPKNAAGPNVHVLRPTPKTVVWGYYDAASKPVLKIKSGDTVEIQTMLTNSPQRLAASGVKDHDIEAELKVITAEVTGDAKGPGGHILTGPIFVEGAEPGDTLEVRIQKIDYSIPYAYNSFSPNRRVLTPEDFSKGATKIIALCALQPPSVAQRG